MLQTQSPDYHEHAASSPRHERSQDLFKVLWKWKWLLMLGGILGASLGVMSFLRQEPTYRASALVQVVYPSAEAAGLDSMDSQDTIRGQSRLDESRIIKSARVIDTAVRDSSLSKHPLLQDLTPSQVRNWILSSERLSVEPAGRDASTALIEIGFVCTDADLSQQVVDAVIAGYDHYLEQAYKNLGEEFVSLVSHAQENLQQSYRELADKHAKFRREAPMIWLGEEARNQFAENSVEVNSSINQIQIRMRKLQATLEHVRQAEQQGRPADAILLMLANDFGLQQQLTDSMQASLSESLPLVAVPARASDELPFSSVERRRELMEMQLKQQELLDTVGEEHPSVATIQRRIQLMEIQISALAELENQLERQQTIHEQTEAQPEISPSDKLKLWRSSLDEQLASLTRQEALLQELSNENSQKSKELQDYLATNRLLNSELASVQALLDGYTDTLKRIQILPKSDRRTLETLTPASKGGFAGPSLTPYLLGGTALGLLCIGSLALLIDFLDGGFRNPEDISETLGLPIIGHLPQMSFKGKSAANMPDASLCTFSGSSREGSEAFRSIRTGLYFSDMQADHRVIQITSPTPGDGKSTVSANLAISIAQSGRSVLLIDADMRRPRIAKLMGKPVAQGLGEVLSGQVAFEDAVDKAALPNLNILASSLEVAYPAELLSSPAFSQLIERLRTAYDFVIVDTPPVLAVADACAVAARVDGVLLTIRLRRDARRNAVQATRLLESVGARVTGVVVNGVKRGHYEYRYGNYGYGNHYGSDSLSGGSPGQALGLPAPKQGVQV